MYNLNSIIKHIFLIHTICRNPTKQIDEMTNIFKQYSFELAFESEFCVNSQILRSVKVTWTRIDVPEKIVTDVVSFFPEWCVAS